MKISRRSILAAAPFVIASPKAAFAAMDARELGVASNTGRDVTAELSSALSRATVEGYALNLPAGDYAVADLSIPDGARLQGHGARLMLSGGQRLVNLSAVQNVSIEGVTFDGRSSGVREDNPAMIAMTNCEHVTFQDCQFRAFEGNGLFSEYSSGTVQNCQFSGFGLSALHLQNSRNFQALHNNISDCANGGIRVWRYEKGFDGSLILGNQINNIRSDWGDGQNGNGVNVFYADGCVVSNNIIRDCHLSAIRANSTKDTIISGNQCHNSLEVGIFSEFEFSGSIVSNNLIDGAATGVSITNLDDDGHLAVCSGNVVRNITPFSPTNPDTIPIGIYVEAEVAVTGNVVEDVPGACIAAGYGPFVRNINITNNILRRAVIGVAVTVADGAGAVNIADNLIAEMQSAPFAGYEWERQVSTDLSNYAHISMSNNRIVN